MQKQMINGGAEMPMSKDERAKEIGNYIVNNDATVRQTAKVFGISKSTVHQDITKRLEKIDLKLYQQVREVLDKNRAERHLRGGMATKAKYEKEGEIWNWKGGDI